MAGKLLMSIGECREALTRCGLTIGQDKLSVGIQQGVFPEFARAVDMHRPGNKGNFEYIIFKKDLQDFIKAHGGDVSEFSEGKNI
ncbi:MAG: hypothetical protein RR424_10815 [Oscillospiraceae bacterium]